MKKLYWGFCPDCGSYFGYYGGGEHKAYCQLKDILTLRILSELKQPFPINLSKYVHKLENLKEE